jgi:thioredoxin 1|tara:strand:+ start:101 stop:496 length:396 start_codon:yes stop_codon:yes gene_type:complete
MKKLLFIIICLFSINANAIEKETTFDKKLFDKAQSEGKVVIVSSWIKYCSSCAGQMKILKTAKKEGGLSDIKFDNIEYFSFDVTNREIAELLKVQFQTTLLIFKDNKEIYRSVGETTKDLLYEAIKSSIKT